ncbi:hypothetical protein JVU11DRAFT_7503 [Chiua virens]|nr:hypothetical protein JVU11DRAFT_7503 [Chiua virens]
MYAAKFTVFYVIATLIAFASASPVPVEAAGARGIRVANMDMVAREPLPMAEAIVIRELDEDLEARICGHGSSSTCL